VGVELRLDLSELYTRLRRYPDAERVIEVCVLLACDRSLFHHNRNHHPLAHPHQDWLKKPRVNDANVMMVEVKMHLLMARVCRGQGVCCTRHRGT